MADLEPMPEDWTRSLVIVAHPDDTEFGAAAAIATWTAAGRSFVYVMVTRGEAGIDSLAPEESARVREGEQRAAGAAVGVDVIEFLDYHDGLIEEGVALRRDLTAAIRRHRPELVVTLNHRDQWDGGHWNTADHRAVGRTVLDAVGDAGNRWLFPDAGDKWDGVRWVAVAGSPMATHAVDVTDHLDPAVASFAAHRRYLEELDDTPAEEQAKTWVERATSGASDRFGGRPAVAFELFAR